MGYDPLAHQVALNREERGTSAHQTTRTLLSFEREGYGVNYPGAWRRLYGEAWGYYRDFGWRACFLGGGE